jgi:nitroreductase
MAQALELMKRRCSVRKFEDRVVEKEKLFRVLEAARVAPSACNYQPWHFVVIEDRSLIGRIAPGWVREANPPLLVVACGDHRQAWRRRDGKDHADIDVAIAVDHITLAAVEAGLGTCWICSFDAFQCALTLNLPNHLEPVALLPIGYPAEVKTANRHDRERKPLDEIVSWGPFPKQA